MTDERPPELCSECQAETGRAGRQEDSLYVETSKGERGPLCQACYTTWRSVAGRVVIRFDGPPAPRSGRLIEIERDGFSISYGDWIEHDGDWLLILPDGAGQTGAEDQVDRCMKDIIDWCKRAMPQFQRAPEFEVAKKLDDELRDICRRHVRGAADTTDEYQGVANDLHKILDALDIGRVRKGRGLIRQRVREGIEELEAEVDRLITVLGWIAEDEQEGIIGAGKASQAIAPGVGRRRRIKPE